MTLFWPLFSITSLLYIYGAYVDYKTFRIPYTTWAGVPLCSLFYHGFSIETLWPLGLTVGIFGLTQVLQRIKKTPVLGYGDLPLLFASLLWLDMDFYAAFFIFTGITGSIIAVMSRRKFIPLVPAIAISWFLCVLWKNFILD